MTDTQIEYWSGPAAQRWVTYQRALDRALSGFGRAALARAAAAPGEHALDVGCGCGDSSLALAEQVAPDGRVTGVDVSAPMLERARQRAAEAPRLQFLLADAASFVPEPPRRFDLVFSRFGVMFFAHPERAFAHLRSLLADAGRLAFVCWRALDDNPWAKLPIDTIQRALPELAPHAIEDGPGPFAFADRSKLEALLGGAGFQQVAIDRFDTDVVLGTATLDEAVEFAVQGGPAARLLAGLPSEALARARHAMSEALAPCRSERGYTLPGSTWLVTAHTDGRSAP